MDVRFDFEEKRKEDVKDLIDSTSKDELFVYHVIYSISRILSREVVHVCNTDACAQI